MANIKKLKHDDEVFYPITHEDAVLEESGTPISQKYLTAVETDGITDITINSDALIGNLNALSTNNKSSVVAAINELFQNANNGKQLIANAIGNALITGDSTFKAMSEAILNLRRSTDNETDAKEVLYNMMIEDGYNEVTDNMSVDELIELLDDSSVKKDSVKQIACGESHVFILKYDGSLWACGYNSDGQLGLNDTNNRTTFTQVTTNINNDVKQIACGQYFTFIIKKDGSIWGCGDNTYGQLGFGTSDDNAHNTFTKVTTNINNDVKQVACGSNHTFILKNDGTIWACGRNTYGQLGLNDTTDRTTFTEVTVNHSNTSRIYCGHDVSFLIKNDKSLYATGFNNSFGLGISDAVTKTTFTQVTTNINNDVADIQSGIYFTILLKTDGTVWATGENGRGQLGLGNTTTMASFTQISSDVVQISCGSYSTYLLKNDGSIWSCGGNTNGQLGIGNTNNLSHTNSSFIKLTTNINNDASQLFSGGFFLIVKKNDYTLHSCGDNYSGQLGLGNNTRKTTLTQVSIFGSTSIDEYEINRQKLYYYLLDNEIPVTEDIDIGVMLDLLVGDYINNMLLGYENNLRIILTDEGVSVSDEDNIDSLITKVDEEFDRKNANSGGLDIISATQLPATGKENQICVISQNPVNNFLVTTNTNTTSNNQDLIVLCIGNASTTSSGVSYSSVTGNYTTSCYFHYTLQNGERLGSYVYRNLNWEVLTKPSLYVMRNGTYNNTSVTGTFITNTGVTYTYNTGLKIRVAYTGSSSDAFYGTTSNNKIDFSSYSTLKIVASHDSTSSGKSLEIYACNKRTSAAVGSISTVRNSLEVAKSTTKTVSDTAKELIIDISTWTGSYYLGFGFNTTMQTIGTYCTISHIELY